MRADFGVARAEGGGGKSEELRWVRVDASPGHGQQGEEGR